ncbi:helix-turn-helix transcriptional regulator [Kribbella sandramycini]|uniref:AraC-like DNA-binding protein n=1 Tax=Kribbella sandramycini TaxID=60450 RepID=A0A7Y4KYE1_9ACTN|nr:AraC family transcriptional regulator [Kribbella sandramycini]MBB6569215.1 AraC-like DNA-binding protein [Kribbella sandramycini]NOL40944.1 helix-turn-helix transcriptional regulator [Kribbella sandramycini]
MSTTEPTAVRTRSEDEVIRAQLDRLRLDLVVAARITKVHPEWSRPLEPDPFSRLYLILEGEGRLVVGDVELYPKPGELCYLPAEVPVSYETISANVFRKHWLHFSALVGDRDIGEVLTLPYIVPSKAPDEAATLFEQVGAADRDPPGLATPLRVRSALTALFAHYLDSAPPGSVRLAGQQSAESGVVQYIQDNLGNPLAVEDLAARHGQDLAGFVRRFRTEYGLSPKQYIKRARIEWAQRELITTARPMEEIAAAVGMDQSYFSKVFRQVSSVTPSEYRKLYRPRS